MPGRAQGVWTLVPAVLDGNEANWLVLRKDALAAEVQSYRPTPASAESEVARGAGWSHEIKWDGYRVICLLEAGQDLTERFRAVAAAVLAAAHTRNCVLDGVPEPSDRVRRSEVFDDGEALLAAAREQRLEGIVSKRDASPCTRPAGARAIGSR